MRKIVFTTLLMIIFAVSAKSQVTIGSGDEPLPISVLELISQTGSESGLRLPQLDDDNSVDMLASQINALSAEDKLKAKGLMIYNKEVECTMVWNGSEFKSLCGDLGKADLEVYCSTIEVYPAQPRPAPAVPTGSVYRQGVSLDDSHYITMRVYCSKKGTYTVTVTTGNGYSFIGTGTFLETGDYNIKLPGQGTPTKGSTTGAAAIDYFDNLTIAINDEPVTTCTSADLQNRIAVYPAESLAVFTPNCSATVANGAYTPGGPLTGSNNISLKLEGVTTGTYSFRAEGNGMTFVRTGTVQGANDVVLTLNGTGTPEKAGTTTLTIYDQITGNLVCSVDIIVAYPAMKILGLGGGIYQPGTATASGSSRTFLLSKNNFGTNDNSTVNVQGISIANGGVTNGSSLQTTIDRNKPDIIVIGYDYNPNADACTVLNTFIVNGGVVINISQNSGLARLTRTVFGESATTAGSSNARSVFNAAVSTDPLINGPFGDLNGQSWLEDVQDGLYFSTVPSTAIILSYQYNSTRPTSIRHPSLGYITWNDGGTIAGDYANTRSDTWPFKLDSSAKPIPKTYSSGTASGVAGYNSAYFGNMMAWAIEYIYNKRNP